MINGKITFILMRTKNPKVGKIYTMIHKGSVVISRKSTKIDIPYKQWDSDNNKAKSSYPDADRINESLDKKIKEFEIINQISNPIDSDKSCALKYMELRIHSSNLTQSSIDKYNTILENFVSVVKSQFKMNYLPFHMLRDITFIRNLKEEIKKSRNLNRKIKSKTGIKNYMSVFAKYVEDWNSYSGTPFPINIRPFTTDIGKDPKKLAVILTHQELQKLIDFKPNGHKNGYPQNLAKNLFLFQYHTGGIRIQDAIFLTNKDIMSDGFQIKIKKTKQVEKFPFCYEQVETLKYYYTFEYNAAINSIKVGDLKISPSNIIQLNRIEGLEDLSTLSFNEFNQYKEILEKQSLKNTSIAEIIPSIQIIEEELKKEISNEFFKLLKRRKQDFLFPLLVWSDFSQNILSSEIDFSKEEIKILHKAKTRHNSNLRRIAKTLELPKISGHTPRHTLANHLYSEDYTYEQIKDVMVHSDINTTKIYLQKRHQKPGVNKTIKEATQIFRKKRIEK